MTRDEFLPGLTALASSLGRDLTDDQRDALWERFQAESLPTWEGVCRLVRERGKWPSLAQWPGLTRAARAELGRAEDGHGFSRSACECGGTIGALMRRDLPPGIRFPLVGLPRAMPPEDRIRHEAENPHLWGQAMLRECSSCRGIYAQAVEECVIQDRNGRRSVAAGELRRMGAEHLAQVVTACAMLGIPTGPANDGPLPDGSDEASEFAGQRLRILRGRLRGELTARSTFQALEELADRYPEKADALILEAAAIMAAHLEARPETPTLREAGLLHCEHVGGIRDSLGYGPLCADCGAESRPDGTWGHGSVDCLRHGWTHALAVIWRRERSRAHAASGPNPNAQAPPLNAAVPSHSASLAEAPMASTGSHGVLVTDPHAVDNTDKNLDTLPGRTNGNDDDRPF